jgi:hypothetical protein
MPQPLKIIFVIAAIVLGSPPASAQTVTITSLGSHDGEFCTDDLERKNLGVYRQREMHRGLLAPCFNPGSSRRLS